jgi:tight adherence protein B
VTSNMVILAASSLVFLALLFLFVGWRAGTLTDTQKRTREQLRRLAMVGGEDAAAPDIMRDRRLSSIGSIDRMLSGTRLARRTELLLYQAGVDMRVGTFLLIVAVVGAGAMLLFGIFFGRPLFALFFGLVAAFIPLAVVRSKRTKRTRLMEEQLPDAMDLMTSALRAGLSLPAALQLVAQEAPSPLAEEFGHTFDEQNLGLDIRDAMINLARRVDSVDIKFFVTAVVVQRETGGNLAEIMENIAHIIRERFRILGDVRTLTAHGRFSGIILSVLPVAMGFLIAIIAPAYMLGFLRDPTGQVFLLLALVLQIFGFMWIRKIVNIRV